jgi:hypothetical protein
VLDRCDNQLRHRPVELRKTVIIIVYIIAIHPQLLRESCGSRYRQQLASASFRLWTFLTPALYVDIIVKNTFVLSIFLRIVLYMCKLELSYCAYDDDDHYSTPKVILR